MLLVSSSSPQAICREDLNLNHLSLTVLNARIHHFSDVAVVSDGQTGTCVRLFQYDKSEMYIFLIPKDTSVSVSIEGYNLTCDIVHPFRDECGTCDVISNCVLLASATSNGLDQCTWECTVLTGSDFLYIPFIDNSRQIRICEIFKE